MMNLNQWKCPRHGYYSRGISAACPVCEQSIASRAPQEPLTPAPAFPGMAPMPQAQADDMKMMDALFQILPMEDVEAEKSAWVRLRLKMHVDHARQDIPALIAEVRRLQALPQGEAPEIPSQGSPGTREAVAPFADKLRAMGYAPGGYDIFCARCEKTVSGCDKRATSCQICAIAALDGGKGREAVEAQPREGKASPGRECWVLFNRCKPSSVCTDDERVTSNLDHGWEWVRMVEADNQEGKEGV